jgi:hypothetical protein
MHPSEEESIRRRIDQERLLSVLSTRRTDDTTLPEEWADDTVELRGQTNHQINQCINQSRIRSISELNDQQINQSRYRSINV